MTDCAGKNPEKLRLSPATKCEGTDFVNIPSSKYFSSAIFLIRT